MQIFFAVSGFLYGKKTIKNFKSWMLQRAQRIWVPVVIVVLISAIVLTTVYHVSIDAVSLIAYLLNLQGLLFINWGFFSKFIHEISILGPLWFATLIMICYCLVPILQRIRDRLANCSASSKQRKYMLYIVLAYVCAVLLEVTTGTSLTYFVVFAIGYFMADAQIDKTQFSLRKALVYFFTVPALGIMRIVLRRFIDGTTLYTALISIGHPIMGISLLCLVIELGKRFPDVYSKIAGSKVMVFLDGASLYIYLLHYIFLNSPTSVFEHFNLGIATILFLLLTIICSIILWRLTDLIVGQMRKLSKSTGSAK